MGISRNQAGGNSMWVDPTDGLPWYIKTYNGGINVDFVDTPILWWDAINVPELLPSYHFRGAIIDYHGFCPNSGTTIGSIMIANDNNNDNIVHTETISGTINISSYWDRTIGSESQLYFSATLATSARIQFTSRVFYGTEYWC